MLQRLCNIHRRVVNPSVVNFKEHSSQVKLSPSYNEKDEEIPPEEFRLRKFKIPLITCKRKEFNCYIGQTYPKFEPIPLASRGWHNKKSRGDFFTIHPLEEYSEYPPEDLTFRDLGVREDLAKNLKEFLRIEQPTKIQQLAIPGIYDFQNTILAAETGCGKTLAYLLPLISQVLEWKNLVERKFNHPLALIISPSRELAYQIGSVTKMLTRNIDVRTKIVVGGSIKKKILNPSVTDVDIIVATLGGLSKLTTNRIYNMSFVRHLVLDEADSLFDETFYDKLRHFLKRIRFGPLTGLHNEFPKYSQLTLASATKPQFVDEVLENIVDPSSFVEVTTEKLHRIFVLQKFLRLCSQEKAMALLKFVKRKAANRHPIIIFVNENATCHYLSLFLREFNVENTLLNGEMSLRMRKGRFKEFQHEIYNVLCTTDAGARGLDTIRVGDVINYDFPLQTAEYIHRCGRTARIGSPKDCRVINFISRPLEILLTQKIEKAARLSKPVPILDYLKRNWTPLEEDEEEIRRSLNKNPQKENLMSVTDEPTIFNDSLIKGYEDD